MRVVFHCSRIPERLREMLVLGVPRQHHEFNESNFNMAFVEQGMIPISWNVAVGQRIAPSEVVLRILIEANEATQLSEVLSFSSAKTQAEAYNESELMNLGLVFHTTSTTVAADRFRLFQNQPNPFEETTTIGFVLPDEGQVVLEIFDVSGKRLHIERGDFASGYNQIELDKGDLTKGVLYYRLSTSDHSDAKKMILLMD